MNVSFEVASPYNNSRYAGARSTRAGEIDHPIGTVPRRGCRHSSYIRPRTKSRLSPSGIANETYTLSSSGPDPPGRVCRRGWARGNADRSERFGTSSPPTKILPAREVSWMRKFSSAPVVVRTHPIIAELAGVAARVSRRSCTWSASANGPASA